MRDALRALRFAWRGLRSTPGPAAAAVLAVALGAGLNTAVLAVAYGVLVVGVVGDVSYAGLHAPASGTIYIPSADLPVGVVNLAVRTAADPRAIAPAVRRLIHRLDPGQPIGDIRPLESVVAGSIADRRLCTWLAGSFAGLALVGLAAALARAVTEPA